MSGGNRMRRTLGIGIVVMLMIAGANAWAWPWKKKSEAKPIPLEEIMRTPAVFQGRTVEFECRFAMRGKLFKYLNTRFNPGEHANFAVWPVDAKLWDRTERRNVLPTIYVGKDDATLLETFSTLGRYEIVRVSGKVLSKYANLPWILVTSVERVEDDEECQENKYTEVGIRHVQNGLKLLTEKKPRVAAHHLTKALEAGIPQKHHGELQIKRGDAYFAYGAYGQAVESFQQAVGLEGEDAELYLKLAEAQLKMGDADAAKQSCEQALLMSADYPLVYAFLGESLAKQGQIDSALEQCELALSTPGIGAQDKAKAEVSKARVLVIGAQYADAVRAYARAIGEGSPLAADAGLRKEIGGLYESRFDENGRLEFLEEAIREYGNAVVLAQNKDAESLFLSARAQYKKIKAQNGTDFAPVLELLNQALAIDSKYTPAIGLKAKIMAGQGKVGDASRLLEQTIQASDVDADTLLTLADLYAGQGRGADALALYARVLEANPTHRIALERRAATAESVGLPADARENYDMLVTLYPQEMAYRLQLGHVSLRMGDVAAAESQWKAVLASDDILGTEAGVQLARMYGKQRNFQAMEVASRAVLERKSTLVEAQWSLARALVEQNKELEEAEGLVRAALAMEPRNLSAIDTLALVLLKQDRKDEAAALLSGVPASERTRVMWLHLGLARGEDAKAAGTQDALLQAAQAPREGEDLEEATRVIEQARALLKTRDDDTAAMAPAASDASGKPRRTGFFSRLMNRKRGSTGETEVVVDKTEEVGEEVAVADADKMAMEKLLEETEREVGNMRNIAETIPLESTETKEEAPAVADDASSDVSQAADGIRGVSSEDFSWASEVTQEESTTEVAEETRPIVEEKPVSTVPAEEDEDSDIVSIPGMVEPQTTKEIKTEEFSTMQGPEVQYRNEVVTVPLAKVMCENESIVRLGTKADVETKGAFTKKAVEESLPETPELTDVSTSLPAWAQ